MAYACVKYGTKYVFTKDGQEVKDLDTIPEETKKVLRCTAPSVQVGKKSYACVTRPEDGARSETTYYENGEPIEETKAPKALQCAILEERERDVGIRTSTEAGKPGPVVSPKRVVRVPKEEGKVKSPPRGRAKPNTKQRQVQRGKALPALPPPKAKKAAAPPAGSIAADVKAEAKAKSPPRKSPPRKSPPRKASPVRGKKPSPPKGKVLRVSLMRARAGKRPAFVAVPRKPPAKKAAAKRAAKK